MKHLATIQAEFLKAAAKWDDLSYEAQKEYLQQHRKSKKKMTAKPEPRVYTFSELSKIPEVKEEIKDKRQSIGNIDVNDNEYSNHSGKFDDLSDEDVKKIVLERSGRNKNIVPMLSEYLTRHEHPQFKEETPFKEWDNEPEDIDNFKYKGPIGKVVDAEKLVKSGGNFTTGEDTQPQHNLQNYIHNMKKLFGAKVEATDVDEDGRTATHRVTVDPSKELDALRYVSTMLSESVDEITREKPGVFNVWVD